MFMIGALMSLFAVGVAADLGALGEAEREDDDDLIADANQPAPDGDEADGPKSMDNVRPADSEPVASEPAEDVPAEASSLGTDAVEASATTETPDDHMIGTDDFDALMGYDGNDWLEGRGGADDLRGGQGDDTLLGGDGDDWVQGESDYGPGGNDLIDGGAGDDSLAGQGGADTVLGGAGDDIIQGGDGNDSLTGGAGRDWIDGNAGDDTLIAGAGEDDLNGGAGNDLLIGNDGPETAWLHGGAGDDTLVAGAGDFAEGQEGSDLYILRSVDGTPPIITGFDGEQDLLELHIPEDRAADAIISTAESDDGSVVVLLNGQTVAQLVGAVNTGELSVVINHTAI